MTNNLERQPVSDYALPEDKIEAFLAYPGPRPKGAFITNGETVTMLPGSYEEFKQAADDFLTEADLPLISDRIPVLAYGANASPDKLASKMRKFDDDQTVPYCAVRLEDTAAVWHGQPGQVGSYFAELFRGPEAKDVILQTHVSFLTIEQLGAIDATEGVTYSKFFTPAKLGLSEDAPETDVLAYVAFKSQVLLESGKPVLVADLSHENGASLSKMTAFEAVKYTLHNVAEIVDVATEPKDFIVAGTELTLTEQKARQAMVKAEMERQGMSRPYSAIADNPESAVPRLDFASVGKDHNLHFLSQMVWSDPEKVRLNVNRAKAEHLALTGLKVIKKET